MTQRERRMSLNEERRQSRGEPGLTRRLSKQLSTSSNPRKSYTREDSVVLPSYEEATVKPTDGASPDSTAVATGASPEKKTPIEPEVILEPAVQDSPETHKLF